MTKFGNWAWTSKSRFIWVFGVGLFGTLLAVAFSAGLLVTNYMLGGTLHVDYFFALIFPVCWTAGYWWGQRMRSLMHSRQQSALND